MAGPSLAEVGEDGLVAAVLARYGRAPAWVRVPAGDDAAVLDLPVGGLVVCTDTLVEGQDFRREWSGGRDVGVKTAVQSLIDIAAMGGRPLALLVSLVFLLLFLGLLLRARQADRPARIWLTSMLAKVTRFCWPSFLASPSMARTISARSVALFARQTTTISSSSPNSARYIPPSTPMGTPMRAARNSSLAEPTIALAMPPPGSPTGVGKCVKKFQLNDLPPL
jgi:hypothetical protein